MARRLHKTWKEETCFLQTEEGEIQKNPLVIARFVFEGFQRNITNTVVAADLQDACNKVQCEFKAKLLAQYSVRSMLTR